MADDNILRERLTEAQQAQFEGWDFSYLDGRMREDSLPWDFEALVREAIPHAQSLLDMDTGGGEKLAIWAPLPAYTAAIEGYPPNVPIARARLEPLGVNVHQVDAPGPLPFSSDTFDLITNRHGAYQPAEVLRILRPGGRFFTQQVGGRNLADLNTRMGVTDYPYSSWNLEMARCELEEAGLIITAAAETFPRTRFLSVEAIVYLLKAVPWQILDFSVDRYFDHLRSLDAEIRTLGWVEAAAHRFLLVGYKPE